MMEELLVRGGDLRGLVFVSSSSMLSKSGTEGAPVPSPDPYKPEYVRGISEEGRRDLLPVPVEVATLSISADEIRRRGVEGAESIV